MNGLERELRALGSLLDWPDPPDVVPAVSARIAAAPRRRGRIFGPDRRLAIVVAVVVAAVAVALAVPPARTAIFDWLGVGSARVELVSRLPALEPSAPLHLLGAPSTLAAAQARAGFPFASPPEDEPAPDEVRVVPGRRVSYVWLDGDRVRLLITQVPSRLGENEIIKKLVPPGATIESLLVGGRRAVWLEGGPHAVFLVAPDGSIHEDRGWLAGATLLVDRGSSTVRIEGGLDRARAVELADAMSG